MNNLIVSVVLCSVISCLGSVLCVPDLLARQHEDGSGKSYEEAQKAAHGEAGKKAYSAEHVNEKGEIGHHDKERHQKEYAEEGGNKKSHFDDKGYHSAGHKESHSEKGHHYADKGSYAKGHDTKGHHNIHKLQEFEKTKQIFDEDHDEAHKELHGAFEEGKTFKNGGFKHGGYDKKVFSQAGFEAKEKNEKGGHNVEEGGHKKGTGKEQAFHNAEEYLKAEGGEVWKKFGFNEKHI
ncbi:unnamed protein product [Ceutorhynchus assimilis]|uniref:Uncharacterized protein n=1 Tax=Ceutorhynchus assimilis TaxID=467358 RepID=A0A9N9QP83_9CUCU|nr:unnamed protein product [Ceutorhynchus assimilis]